MTISNAPSIDVVLSEPLGDGFDQPQAVSDVLHAFPANLGGLMPPWESIPEQFRSLNSRTEWNRFVSSWFFTGWPTGRLLYARPDVDPEAAFRHLETIMRSFEPKHEHKEAAVAWLMSRWYADIRPMTRA